jgi:hypothetical protein
MHGEFGPPARDMFGKISRAFSQFPEPALRVFPTLSQPISFGCLAVIIAPHAYIPVCARSLTLVSGLEQHAREQSGPLQRYPKAQSGDGSFD